MIVRERRREMVEKADEEHEDKEDEDKDEEENREVCNGENN